MHRTLRSLFACSLLCVLSLGVGHSAPVLLTTQTQSVEHMQALTGQRQLLLFEATQSSVVDVNENYLVTPVQSVPTLSLLDGISFNNETETWSFSYETMAVDSSVSGQINHYYRILYLTRAGHDVGSSDSGNPCLEPAVDYAACLDALRSEYVVLEPAGSDAAARDRLETTTWLCAECPPSTANIEMTVQPRAFSATQSLQLQIPHAVIRYALSRHRNSTHSDSPAFEQLGTQKALDFGVGMMFLPKPDSNTQSSPPNNLLIFDMFTVLENTFEQLAIMKQTSYSIATHVAFWTAASESNEHIRVVTIEYLLDLGHLLTDVKVAVNNGSLDAGGRMVAITPADCLAMQLLIDALPDSRCIAQHALCVPKIYMQGSGAQTQTWATVIFPIPEWHTSADFQFNTLLFSNLSTADNGRGRLALSTLNFFTSHAPRVSCQAAETVAFDATHHVIAALYRGHMMVAEHIQGTFTVFNESSLSSAEALVTLVLRPDDTMEALEYFQTYTDERLRLDELYMSHGRIHHNFPSHIANEAVGAGDGRTTLQLDAELAQGCPQSLAQVGSCVTTKDWDLLGPRLRTDGSVYYVHQVSGDAQDETEDLQWLSDNIFGPSDHDTLKAFRDATLSKTFPTSEAQSRKQYASIFWIWPVFAWPNTGLVGLEDETIVSVAWSITH